MSDWKSEKFKVILLGPNEMIAPGALERVLPANGRSQDAMEISQRTQH
jgi:hypothetical protein